MLSVEQKGVFFIAFTTIEALKVFDKNQHYSWKLFTRAYWTDIFISQ